MKRQWSAAVLLLLVPLAPAQPGCVGGQTGTPTGGTNSNDGDVDAGCLAHAIDLDDPTPLGFAPSALWTTFVGHYEQVAYWSDRNPRDAGAEPDSDRASTRLIVDVRRDDGIMVIDVCDSTTSFGNSVRVPVAVQVATQDGLLRGTAHAWLVGTPSIARIDLPREPGDFAGWIGFEHGRLQFRITIGDAAGKRSVLQPLKEQD